MSEADPPSNLWQDLLDKATRADGAGNCSLLVVGDVGAGKRGLVRALQARAAGADGADGAASRAARGPGAAAAAAAASSASARAAAVAVS